MSIEEELRRIAQNDYMIDDEYLPDGMVLINAAEELNRLEEEVESLDGRMYSIEYYESMYSD